MQRTWLLHALIIASLALPNLTHAAGWAYLDEPTSRTLNAIDASGDTVIAVGSSGTVVYSDDSGRTWDDGDSNITSTLYDVDVINEDDAVAVGSNGTVIVTDDGGRTWDDGSVPNDVEDTGYDLYAVSMATSAVGYAVGEHGLVLRTLNYGSSWTDVEEVNDGEDALFDVVASTASTAWVVGEGGLIAKTSAAGTSWTEETSHVTGNLRSVSFTGSSDGWVGGDDGALIRTTNGGTTWTEQDVDELDDETVIAVSFYENDGGMLVTAEGTYLETDDEGDTWDNVDSYDSPSFSDAIAVSSSEWWAVGEGGTVYRYDASSPDRPDDFEVSGDDEDIGTSTPSFTWDKANDDETSIDHYLLKISGESTRDVGNVTSYTWPSSLDDDDYTASLYAVDAGGNESSAASLDFTIHADGSSTNDADVSTVTPTTAVRSQTVTFSVRLSDSDSIVSCDLYLDGEREKSMTVKTDVAYVGESFSSNGTYNLYVQCEDDNGDRVSGNEVTVTVASSSSHADPGDIIKMACEGNVYVNDPCTAVYYYGKDGKRHAFPNEDVFKSWFSDYDDLVVLSSDAMAEISLGRNVVYRPEEDLLVKFSTNSVYAVSYLGVLRPIVGAEIASAINGSDWVSDIRIVNDVFYGNYRIGSNIESSSDYSASSARSVTSSIDATF